MIFQKEGANIPHTNVPLTHVSLAHVSLNRVPLTRIVSDIEYIDKLPSLSLTRTHSDLEYSGVSVDKDGLDVDLNLNPSPRRDSGESSRQDSDNQFLFPITNWNSHHVEVSASSLGLGPDLSPILSPSLSPDLSPPSPGQGLGQVPGPDFLSPGLGQVSGLGSSPALSPDLGQVSGEGLGSGLSPRSGKGLGLGLGPGTVFKGGLGVASLSTMSSFDEREKASVGGSSTSDSNSILVSARGALGNLKPIVISSKSRKLSLDDILSESKKLSLKLSVEEGKRPASGDYFAPANETLVYAYVYVIDMYSYTYMIKIYIIYFDYFTPANVTLVYEYAFVDMYSYIYMIKI